MGLKSFLGLSFALAKAEFKLRNEGSYLGILWYLLNPILMFLLLLAIFATRLGQNIPHYPLYLLLGIIMFNSFQFATIESTKVIITHNRIIKSIKFPHEAMVSSTILKALFSHIFEILVFAILLFALGIPITRLLFYPIILIFLLVFSYGVSLALSALTVYFIDLENIWLFLSRLIWFGTPIFYAVEGQTRLFLLNLFNPMYYFITLSREIIIYGNIPQLWMLAGMVLYTMLALVIGLLIFNSLKDKFAERI